MSDNQQEHTAFRPERPMPPAPTEPPARPAMSSALVAPPQQPAPHFVHHQTVVMVNQKSTAIAYLLWFFFGSLGIHKFYLNQTGLGILYLCLTLVGWATTFILIGFLFLGVVLLMLFIDLFLIPGRTTAVNRQSMYQTVR